MVLYLKEVVMTQQATNKYGIKMVPRTTKTRPKNVQSLNDDNVDIIEIAKKSNRKA